MKRKYNTDNRVLWHKSNGMVHRDIRDCPACGYRANLDVGTRKTWPSVRGIRHCPNCGWKERKPRTPAQKAVRRVKLAPPRNWPTFKWGCF